MKRHVIVSSTLTINFHKYLRQIIQSIKKVIRNILFAEFQFPPLNNIISCPIFEIKKKCTPVILIVKEFIHHKHIESNWYKYYYNIKD